jgi:hypothetical protein
LLLGSTGLLGHFFQVVLHIQHKWISFASWPWKNWEHYLLFLCERTTDQISNLIFPLITKKWTSVLLFMKVGVLLVLGFQTGIRCRYCGRGPNLSTCQRAKGSRRCRPALWLDKPNAIVCWKYSEVDGQ